MLESLFRVEAWPTPPRGWSVGITRSIANGRGGPHLRISLRTLPLCLADL